MPRASWCVLAGAALLAGVVACGGDDPAAGPAPFDGGGGDDTGDDEPGPDLSSFPDCDVAGAAAKPKGYLAAQTLTVAGTPRTYNLFVPETHGPKLLPLVFVFHGDGGNGAGMRGALPIEGEARGAAIVVYPDAFGGWDLDTPPAQNKDVQFVQALVSGLGSSHCVDKSRVFATGYSNGGYFSNQLGCRLGRSVFRGVASHAGGGPYGGNTDYDENGDLVCAGEPVAALVAHGQNDTGVLPEEGIKSREHWRRVNGCQEATQAFAPSPCVQYTGCASGRPVVYCDVPGVGHTVWPQGGAKATWRFVAGL